MAAPLPGGFGGDSPETGEHGSAAAPKPESLRGAAVVAAHKPAGGGGSPETGELKERQGSPNWVPEGQSGGFLFRHEMAS